MYRKYLRTLEQNDQLDDTFTARNCSATRTSKSFEHLRFADPNYIDEYPRSDRSHFEGFFNSNEDVTFDPGGTCRKSLSLDHLEIENQVDIIQVHDTPRVNSSKSLHHPWSYDQDERRGLVLTKPIWDQMSSPRNQSARNLSALSKNDIIQVLPAEGQENETDKIEKPTEEVIPAQKTHKPKKLFWPISAANIQHADPESPPSAGSIENQLTYSWNKVNVYTKFKKRRTFFGKLLKTWGKSATNISERHILKDVSGLCRPGELLAIMGASGAGKTTLLNVLTSRNNDNVRVTGELFLNGKIVEANYLTQNSAYVQQDDMFIGTLTTREQLIFQAMLRMDRHLTYTERMLRVDEVISELGLTKCKNTKIGIPGLVKGISGGEMKRLGFACEVLTNPPILFCDEPTSGLDSFMAQNVVAVMKNMAEKGKTIISTIHQPSSEVYAMFDRLLLMAEGRVAFLGDVDAAYDFFGRISMPCPPNYNPADFFILTLAVQPGQEDKCRRSIHSICDHFQDSDEGQSLLKSVQDNQKPPPGKDFFYDSDFDVYVNKSPYKASWFTQFRNVLWRSWLEIVREPMLVRVRFFQVVLISVIVGVIYFNQPLNQDTIININGAMFLFLTNMTFQNVFGVINNFCKQIPIFLREHFNGMYRTDVYFISKSMAELPFMIINPLVFVAITYFMIGLYAELTHFLICALIIVLVANTSTSFGYLLSCGSSSLNMALVIAAPCVVPLMLFGGFLMNKGLVPDYLSWIQYISWFRYANEALNINQWQDITSIQCTNNDTCLPNGQAVLAVNHYDENDISMDIIGLFILLIVYRIMAFFLLLLKTYRKKR